MTNHHPPSGSFFSGLIDYAGLFPPAALGLSDAVKNYSDYQRSSERWILSRFIGATPHILALTEELLSPFSVSSPLEVSLVTKDPAADLPKVLAHGEALGGRFVVRALEVALPCVEDVAAIAPGITEAALPVLRCPIFFELGAGVEWEEHLTKLLDAIHTLREARHEVGFKLRCGGVEPQQIPPPARVAHALFESAARSLPMKFTAGLHHPFRHPQKDPFPPMHGYFNIFFAALVAHSAHRPAKTLERIVSEMTDLSPVVSAGEIAWLGFTVTAPQVAAARRDFALSYGSCSFLEPLEDARTLKWL